MRNAQNEVSITLDVSSFQQAPLNMLRKSDKVACVISLLYILLNHVILKLLVPATLS